MSSDAGVVTSTQTVSHRPETALGQVAVALDLSLNADRAVPVGAALARQADVPLELVVVRSPGMDPEVDFTELRQRVALAGLEPFLVVLRDDDPAGRLCEFGAEDERVLCLSAHGRGSLTSAILGSVSRQVAENAEHPTVLVGPKARVDAPRFDTIVVGVDPAYPNDTLLDTAGGWAKVLGARVHLVAVEEAVNWMLAGTEPIGHRLERVLNEDAARIAARGLEVRTTVIHVGRPATALVDVTHRDGQCLLLVSTGHRSALSAVTARVVHMAPVPVIVASAD
jgi:nucleotide-binding universal stress UspA family protein